MLSVTLAAAMGFSDLPQGRWHRQQILPGIASARLDDRLTQSGIAQSVARLHKAQARVLWIDGTANIGTLNTVEKIQTTIARAKRAGFNTIVYDLKPIVGYTLYPSALTDQLTAWKGQSMPKGFDPARNIVAECRRQGLGIFAALNAFSEGHRFSKRDENDPKSQFGHPGWGYDKPELQTWQYTAQPILGSFWIDGSFPIHPAANPNAWTEPVAIFTKLPVGTAPLYASLDADGMVQEIANRAPGIPAGGSVLALRGPAIDWIRRVGVGRSVSVKSKASFAPIGENQTQIPLMMNPVREENQARAEAFLKEVATKYDVDGLIYDDRLRWGGINADFSQISRDAFEKRIGRKINWPDDVYRFEFNSRLNVGADGSSRTVIKPGPWFDAWLTWRVEVMQKWVQRARTAVKKVKPKTKFSVYAGSWYGDYQNYGSNYGSTDLYAGFPFLSPAYRRAGFAKDIDFLITGCYYPVPTIWEANARGRSAGTTVEAAAAISTRVVRDQTWTYAGIMLADYWANPADLELALQAAAANAQGIMVFDLSHQIERFWPVFDRAFATPARAPHDIPGLIGQVRQRRTDWDRKGWKTGPFPMLEGAPGAGF